MNNEVKNRWVKALKTNQFLEAPKNVLIHDYQTRIEEFTHKEFVVERFSPIGVLVELFRQDKGIKSTKKFWQNCWAYGSDGYLHRIEEWAGFDFTKDKYRGVFASIMQADTHLHQVQAVWIKKYMPVNKIVSRLKVAL
jgi:hypothetical protein